MALIFVTYSTPELARHRDALAESARKVGFDTVLAMAPEDISGGTFWRRNVDVLSQARGAGYWLWKPYVIREAVRSSGPDDVVFYCDAGRDDYYRFSRRPDRLLQLARDSEHGFLPGVLVPQYGPMRVWTKRDCFVLLDADRPEVHDAIPIQATWSAWTGRDASVRFLDDWLRACEDPRCLTDIPNECGPNLPGFIDHRHDQAIASILACTRGVKGLDLNLARGGRGFARLIKRHPTHRFLKRPGNVDAALRGRSPAAALAAELLSSRLRDAFARRFGRGVA